MTSPPTGRPEVITPQLSAKVASRADKLVREIITGYESMQPAGTLTTDEWRLKRELEVVKLRVLVGMALHDAASYGLLDAYVRRSAQVAPPATTKTDPAYVDDSVTTKKYKRAQNPDR